MGRSVHSVSPTQLPKKRIAATILDNPLRSIKKKKTSSVYDCTVEDVEYSYICNGNSTLCLFYFAIFVVLLLS